VRPGSRPAVHAAQDDHTLPRQPLDLPRTGKLILLSNPQDNAELDLLYKRLEKLEDKGGVMVYVVWGINSSVNPFNTRRQMTHQKALMDKDDEARWHGGEDNVDTISMLLPERRCTENVDDEMQLAIDKSRIPYVRREGMDLIHDEFSPVEGRIHVTTGDPGQANPVRMTLNNVPVVTVWDVTEFAKGPIKLAYFAIIDRGKSRWAGWKESTVGADDKRRNCLEESPDRRILTRTSIVWRTGFA
jgi:hypothetical protein